VQCYSDERPGPALPVVSSAEISFHAAFAPRPTVVLAGLTLLIVVEIFLEGIGKATCGEDFISNIVL